MLFRCRSKTIVFIVLFVLLNSFWAYAEPLNDNFISAEIISGDSGSISSTNVDATAEPGEPNPAGVSDPQSSIWYTWTAPSSDTFLFTTEGSDFDTTIGVYTGQSVDNLILIADNDDYSGSQSGVSFTAVEADEYYILVGGYQGAQGNVQLNWSTYQETLITGTIKRAGGDDNTQPVYAYIYYNGSHSWKYTYITIPVDTESVDFELSVDPGDWGTLQYDLTSQNDYVYASVGYYNPTGTQPFSRDATNVYSNNPPDPIELELIPGIRVSGKIALPSGETYSENVEGYITLRTVSEDHLDSVWFSIGANTSEVTWQANIAPDQDQVIVQSQINRSNFDPGPSYLDSAYYSSEGMVGLAANADVLDCSFTRENIDLVLLKGDIISGVISLEGSDEFSADAWVQLTASWGNNWFDSVYTGYYPDEGSTSLTYMLAVPPDAHSSYALEYYLDDPSLENYQRFGYYSSSPDPRGGYCRSMADTFSPGSDHPFIDFTFLKGYSIGGSVRLPDGATAAEDLVVSLGTVMPPEGEYATTVTPYFYERATITADSNSAEYEVSLPVSCEGSLEEYYLGYRQNSKDYVYLGYYKNNSETVGLLTNGRTFTEGQSYTDINIEVIRGNEISGTISVPDGMNVPENGLAVKLGSLQEPSGIYHTTVIIEPLTTSSDYTIRVAPDVGDTALGYKVQGYSDLAPKGYYSGLANINGVSGRFDYAEMMDPTIPNPGKDFTLDPGNEVSGVIYAQGEPDSEQRYNVEVTLAADPDDPATVYWDTVLRVSPGESIPYSTRVILDTHTFVQFKNEDNSEWLPLGYYYDEVSSVETMLEATQLIPYEDHLFTNLFLGTSMAGDLNFDGSVNLLDVILGLQILTGAESVREVSPAADVNGDGLLGLPEVIHILEQQ